jgi:hypothetical protein
MAAWSGPACAHALPVRAYALLTTGHPSPTRFPNNSTPAGHGGHTLTLDDNDPTRLYIDPRQAAYAAPCKWQYGPRYSLCDEHKQQDRRGLFIGPALPPGVQEHGTACCGGDEERVDTVRY